MGTSEHWQIPRVVDNIMRIHPKTVLDVGGGYGKFGLLVREYSEISRVDILDVAPPRYHVYDNVYIGSATDIDTIMPPDAPHYDLALFIEVIEHMTKDDAWGVLDELTSRAARVIVTTPWGFRRQEFEGLPYETHRSGWYPWEFGRRYKVHRTQIYPGYYTRVLHLPRHWQQLVVLSKKA